MRLHDFLDYWARERPGAEFVFGGGRSLTFAEAAAAASRLANRLAGIGCGQGTRVAVLARNAPWYPLLYFAAAKAGVVLLPLNCRLAQPEWLRILHDAQPAALSSLPFSGSG